MSFEQHRAILEELGELKAEVWKRTHNRQAVRKEELRFMLRLIHDVLNKERTFSQ